MGSDSHQNLSEVLVYKDLQDDQRNFSQMK